MNKRLYLIICMYTATHAQIEIHNQSSQPFKITSTTYEHNNGLQKTPAIELTTQIVAAHSNISLSPKNRVLITNITAIHNGKSYAFDFSPGTRGVLMITPNNEIKLLGPMFLEKKTGMDISIPEEYRGIRKL